MAITHNDIARAAGVDRTTVSRALSDHGRMNPETRERIKKIARELKYMPNKAASNLALGRSDLIGIMIASDGGTMLHPVLRYAEQRLRQSGYTTSLLTHSGRGILEHECIAHFIERRAAGVIAMPSSATTDPLPYQELIDRGIKLVIFDTAVEGLTAPSVIANDYQATHIATEYLISLGHSDIVYLAMPQTYQMGRDRYKGFCDAMQAAGLQVKPESIIYTEPGMHGGEDAVRSLLKHRHVPTAIIARHDLVAIGAMRSLFAAGFRVPDDVSVIGYEDMWCNDIIRVPLSSIRHPAERIATTSAQILIDALENNQPVINPPVLDVELVTRSSCAPPRKC